MSHLAVFLNARIEGSGVLAGIGNKGLAPLRYLFNGLTIQIRPAPSLDRVIVTHEPSFKKPTRWDVSSLIKTALAIVLLIPGLFFAIAKGFAYLSKEVRVQHHLAKEHLTPLDREIGSIASPIQTRRELKEALRTELHNDLMNRPTGALIIHGNGSLALKGDPGIFAFNPMKLILDGAQIVPEERLANRMSQSRKWILGGIKVVGNSPESQKVPYERLRDYALKAVNPRRGWTTCHRFHVVYTFPRL